MKLFSLLLSIFFFIYFIILSSCANQKQPTGGPRDTIPPSLVSAVPQDQSVNFRGNQIILDFDEFIKTESMLNNLIITPSVGEEYDVKFNRRTVQIEFEENTFKENTTYTFNFQDAIQDITEGNPWEDSKLVFSTGPYLDSLFITGNVNYLLNNKSPKSATVALYYYNDTLDLFTGKPPYFTKTDKEGNYILENIKSDTFDIYAFVDQNNNLMADPKSESYAYLTTYIQLDSSINQLDMPLISLNVTPLELTSARPYRYYFDLSYNKYVTEYKILPFDTSLTINSNFADEHNKIRVYNTFQQRDSIEAIVIAEDSISQYTQDTVFIKFEPYTLKPESFTTTFKPEASEPITENFIAKLKATKPITTINYDSIFFKYDSISFIPVEPADITINQHNTEIIITKKLDKSQSNSQEGQPANVQFYAAAGSFMSVENDSSASIKRTYNFIDPTNFGTIKGSIISDYNSYRIQLLNENFELIKEIENQANFTFNYIPPGNYRIRVLVDNNNNGEWDPGNIKENKSPEEVVFYKSEEEDNLISLKANWERTDINITIP
ncbi:MAG: Ig-like domain-containing protein [Candidatus Cyclobacteriaceae bacterium M3_2C_046]